MQEVIVIGAGAAGLAAADELSEHGVNVTLLEARARLGGRIHTVRSQEEQLPIELGAEFIHGRKNEVWDYVRAAKLKTHQVPDRHWRISNGKLNDDPRFWNELAGALEGINHSGRDLSAQEWLENTDLPVDLRRMVRSYVEGFHAAPANQMSVQALAKANQASERDEAQDTFRIQDGYGALIRLLAARLEARKVKVHFSTVVSKVIWRSGSVEVRAKVFGHSQTFRGRQALITLPLGVLKNRSVVFEPRLLKKQEAIDSLEMGHAVKVSLQFRSRFWPVENFGFIHSDQEVLPTWWADERGLLLTGWVGGPRTEPMERENDATITSVACRTLARIFDVDRHRIESLLIDSRHFNWRNDPFAGGAYSFTPVGKLDAPQKLGESIADTLFFAGEATDFNGEQGTVHAALASGVRAAREMQACFFSRR